MCTLRILLILLHHKSIFNISNPTHPAQNYSKAFINEKRKTSVKHLFTLSGHNSSWPNWPNKIGIRLPLHKPLITHQSNTYITIWEDWFSITDLQRIYTNHPNTFIPNWKTAKNWVLWTPLIFLIVYVNTTTLSHFYSLLLCFNIKRYINGQSLLFP